MSNNQKVFSEESIQQVLDTLFALATEGKNTTAIKLYLELATEQTGQSSAELTLAQAVELLKSHDSDSITLD